ncbi:MAG TPA: hypothetical protein VMT52_17430 [Planctomycetota bacterium]|nr:hypothetical protein [Planctomycetota bacterium]
MSLDFEEAPAGLDGVVLGHSTVAAHAHAGSGSLEAHLDQGPSFFDALSKLLGPSLIPFLLADTVHAQWFVQWDAALEVDAAKLRPLLENRLADSPGALTPAQTIELWKLVAVIENAAGSFPSIAPGIWHCFEASYTFPADLVPGSLDLKLDGATLLSFDDLSILEHLPAVEAVLDQIFGGKVVVTSATRAWLDDLLVSTEPTSCN